MDTKPNTSTEVAPTFKYTDLAASRALGNARLLRLADFLETLPPAKFEYSTWNRGIPTIDAARTSEWCGTTACALGWATAIPEFQALGLCIYNAQEPREIQPYGVGLKDGGPCAYGDTERESARVVFGLDAYGFEAIFIPDEDFSEGEDDLAEDFCGPDATSTQVAKRIRTWVAANSAVNS